MTRLRWLYRLASVAAWASRRCLSLHGWANRRAVPVRPAPRVSVVRARLLETLRGKGLDLDSLPRGTFVHLPLPDSASYAVAARAREALYLLGRQGEGRA